MSDREVMQQALKALESGLAFDKNSEVLQNLRTALAESEQQAEPVADEWAKLLHYPDCWDTAAYPTLHDAVHEALACSGCSVCKLEQQAEPVAWDVFELRLYGAPQEKQHRVLWVDRYTYPDGSTPDLDSLLEAARAEGGIDGRAKTLHVRPLYTVPPQQQSDPLIEEQRLDIVATALRGHASTRDAIQWAIEAVERHHGIKEGT